MLKQVIVLLSVSAAAGLFALGACSSDDSTPSNTASATSCMDTPVDPKFTSNFCNNVADKCFLQNHNADVYTAGAKCATTNGNTAPDGGIGTQPGCLQFAGDPTSADAVKCEQDCITGALGPTGISRDCAKCSAAVSACGVPAGCVAPCVADAHSMDCLACLCKQTPDAVKMGVNGSCLIDVFADCAGFAPTAMQVGCPAGSM